MAWTLRLTLSCLFALVVLSTFSLGTVADAHRPLAAIKTVAGCRTRIARKLKRRRCIACIKRGGHFHKRGARAGFCH